ncbi:MAG: RNA exonuclease 3 [Ramalina farinacea]|uniref:RNA exonuclease 3 n=1 Tax=Ramalina farinacea TaxID=258253 RepID=A0AA43TXT9_9LECA|nr:RNA exonuclease 3 [Ramalina farinacea]
MFAHQTTSSEKSPTLAGPRDLKSPDNLGNGEYVTEVPRKKRRLDGEFHPSLPPASVPTEDAPNGRSLSGSGSDMPSTTFSRTNNRPSDAHQGVDVARKPHKTTKSPATPIPTLNPRMLTQPPASHTMRLQLIKLMYVEMSRLNGDISQSSDPSEQALKLSERQLIEAVHDEEETAAKDSPAVYANVLKLRIAKLRKMQLSGWKEERVKQEARIVGNSKQKCSALEAVETGLLPDQEIAFLQRLIAKQRGLEKFNYVIERPNQDEVSKAEKGVEASNGWEQCDRCKTRFQVFPGRRKEDGALTSGGPCRFHPARPRRAMQRDKVDTASRESVFACCSETVGVSIGCTTAPSHVYKISDAKRLALIEPFEDTPKNPGVSEKKSAVCFDCEMGYTTMGLELIRMTATSWPSGERLADVLVRPKGEILDFNTRFSGVRPEDYARAAPYGEKADQPDHHEAPSSSKLSVVDSIPAARTLLLSYLDPSTPLIGHAIDNDLNATRLIHPSIIDTVLLYPHPRGLPMRFGLKALMKRHLDRDIQMGGSAGHDSGEDARAAGELVKLRVAETWRRMKAQGWMVEESNFVAPMTRADAMRADISKVKALG